MIQEAGLEINLPEVQSSGADNRTKVPASLCLTRRDPQFPSTLYRFDDKTHSIITSTICGGFTSQFNDHRHRLFRNSRFRGGGGNTGTKRMRSDRR